METKERECGDELYRLDPLLDPYWATKANDGLRWNLLVSEWR
jgi:hypothetical protein